MVATRSRCDPAEGLGTLASDPRTRLVSDTLTPPPPSPHCQVVRRSRCGPCLTLFGFLPAMHACGARLQLLLNVAYASVSIALIAVAVLENSRATPPRPGACT
jgi:hypothetical protein